VHYLYDERIRLIFKTYLVAFFPLKIGFKEHPHNQGVLSVLRKQYFFTVLDFEIGFKSG